MNLKIFQIYYNDSQKSHLDPGFTPYNNAGKHFPYNFEYAVLFDIYTHTDWTTTDLVGTVSWKFQQKTDLSSNQLKEHIAANPGFDVYFVNPFPELCIYKSVWEQGDHFHPNLSTFARTLLKDSGYQADLTKTETAPYITAYCNYWVANKNFWDAYIKFLTPLWVHVQKIASDQNQIIKAESDRLTGSPNLPFIFERLFSSFLAMSQFKISSLPIYTEKHPRYPVLSPLYYRISKMSQAKSHEEVSLFDRMLITSFHNAKKFVNYHLRYFLRKIQRTLKSTP